MDTIESLKETVSQLRTDNKTITTEKNAAVKALEALTTKHETLSGQHTSVVADKDKALGDLKELTTTYNALKSNHDAFVLESTNEIGRLSQELTSAKSDADNSIVSVSVSNKKYQVIGKTFNVQDRGTITLEELRKDQKLLKELVDLGVGFLVPVQEKSV